MYANVVPKCVHSDVMSHHAEKNSDTSTKCFTRGCAKRGRESSGLKTNPKRGFTAPAFVRVVFFLRLPYVARHVLVPISLLWKTFFWQKKKKLEYREQVEVRVVSTRCAYERGGTRLRTSVYFTRKKWERRLGKTSCGVEFSATASPRLVIIKN